MNTCFDPNTAFFHPNWNADQLAAAVPLRLYQMFSIDHIGEPAARAPANQAAASHRTRASSYVPDSALPARFRIR